MNIIMVGDSSVGKTTFMVSTYGLMSDGEIEGFRVRCKNDQAHKKLLRAYNDFRTEGLYPPATVQMSRYEYDFFSNQEWVMKFSLTDIRGESIHDYDVDELSDRIRKADAMMLFLNGYDIDRGMDVSEQVADIYILLNNCFVSDDEMKLILVIFSQMDRIDTFTEETWKKLNDTVSELEKMAEKNDNIVYLAIPIACSLDCMMDLDYTMMTMMLFGYSTEVLKRYKAMEQEQEAIRKQFGEYDSFWKKTGRAFLDAFGLDEDKNIARSRAAELQKELEEYKKMIKKFERLESFCDKYQLGTSYKIKRRWSSKEQDPFKL